MIKNLFFSYSFIKHNKKLFTLKKKKKNKILIDFFEYKPSMIPISYIANVLAEKYNAEIIGVDCAANIFHKNLKQNIKIILQKIWFLSNWNIYRSFGTRRLISPKIDKLIILKSKKIYKKLIKKITNKKHVLEISIDKINIGDLIYDDYLRQKNCSTIDINKDDFKNHLLGMIQIFIFWNEYVKNNIIKACYVSHTVYRFGILSRIAIHYNIKVLNGGLACTYSLDKKNKLSSTGYHNYPKTFKIIKEKVKKDLYKIAKKELEGKLTGKIDITQIMNKQTFKSFSLNKNNKTKYSSGHKGAKTTILVAAHCFTDAVHAFDRFLFLDFHDWLDFLGKMSNMTDYRWLIKLHPAQFDINETLIKYFINKYPKFELVEKLTTHNDLMKNQKIAAALTVCGSIGHEYPLFGIPVVNAHPTKSSPHNAYNFNINPKTVNELKKIILNIKKIDFKITSKLKKKFMNIITPESLLTTGFYLIIRKFM